MVWRPGVPDALVSGTYVDVGFCFWESRARRGEEIERKRSYLRERPQQLRERSEHQPQRRAV
jgi:hypothetical protein